MIDSRWWIFPLLIEGGIRLVTRNHIKPSEVLATTLYAFVLIVRNRIVARTIGNYRLRKVTAAAAAMTRKPIPTTSTMAISSFRMDPMEVVLGLNRRNRPVKADFARHHTLIAGTTGGGKTNIINSILIQLFAKGTEFTSQCEVILIDLKGHHEEDYLYKWAPLLREYYSVSSGYGGAENAIARLEQLAEDLISKPKSDKHLLLVIDEVAAMTDIPDPALKRRGRHVLIRLASRGRTRMTLIAATQYPQYETIPRSITANMDRKIGLWVDDVEQAKLIFRFRPKERLPQSPGEFLLRNPASKSLKSGTSFLVHLPHEIDNIVGPILESQLEDDPRVLLFTSMCATLKIGDKVPGINRAYRSNEYGLTHKQVGDYYRNYALCGVFDEPKNKGESYKLSMTYQDAIESIRARIASGSWQEAPEAFI